MWSSYLATSKLSPIATDGLKTGKGALELAKHISGMVGKQVSRKLGHISTGRLETGKGEWELVENVSGGGAKCSSCNSWTT